MSMYGESIIQLQIRVNLNIILLLYRKRAVILKLKGLWWEDKSSRIFWEAEVRL